MRSREEINRIMVLTELTDKVNELLAKIEPLIPEDRKLLDAYLPVTTSLTEFLKECALYLGCDISKIKMPEGIQ